MKLTVLGSGKSNIGLPFRNTASHLIEASNTKILLDCGDGTRGQLSKLGLSAFDIDAVFFSHFHPDHFSPNAFIQDYLVRKFEEPGINLKLSLYGPIGLLKALTNSWDALWGDGKFEELIIQRLGIEITELSDKEETVVSDLKVTAITVKHSYLDALAFRVEHQQKVISYSGDATTCAGLSIAARNANLFLCEAAIPSAGSESNELHVSAVGAARIAEENNVQRLVLTHYSEEPASMLLAIEKAKINVSTEVANDLSSYHA